MPGTQEFSRNSRYHILPNAVDETIFKKLRIKKLSEATLEGEELEAPTPVIELSGASIIKLGDYGYHTCNFAEFELGDKTIRFVGLANPDGTHASADVDPAKLRVVNFVNCGWSADFQDRVRDVIKKSLVSVIDKNVTLTRGSGKIDPADGSGNMYHIYCGASGEEGLMTAHSNRMWDISVDDTSSTQCGFWMAGDPIVSAEGAEVGAFDANNTYIYHNLLSQGTNGEVKILDHILKFVTQMLKAGPSADTAALVKQRYVKVCGQRAEARKATLKGEVKRLDDNIEGLNKELVSSIRNRAQVDGELTGISRFANAMDKQLSDEFDQLLAMGPVKAVDWRGDTLVVTTDVLYCEHPEEKTVHEIGAFKLLIDANRGEVLFNNLTRKVHGFKKGMNGPHLFPDGRACLGNMREMIPQLVAEFEWSALVSACLMFIQSVNIADDAGSYIKKWPVDKARTEERERKRAMKDVTGGDPGVALAAETAAVDAEAAPRV